MWVLCGTLLYYTYHVFLCGLNVIFKVVYLKIILSLF